MLNYRRKGLAFSVVLWCRLPALALLCATLSAPTFFEACAAETLDLAMVVDRSGSTAAPSGTDIDGDGTVDWKRLSLRLFGMMHPGLLRYADLGDSILAAELAGARNLLQFLNPANTRISVISLGGRPSFPRSSYPRRWPDARVEQSLTSDHGKVQKALLRIGIMGPQGYTNLAAAIRAATAQLTGAKADSSERPGAERGMVVFSDGFPNLPTGAFAVSDPEDAILALQAALLARKAGIKIHTYGLGARAAPFVLTEIARIGGGRFYPITDPSRIVDPWR